MTDIRPRSRRLARFLGPLTGALLTMSLLGAANVAAAGDASTPMVLQNVSLEDIVNNKLGICNGSFTHVMKSAAGPTNARNYLNAAQKCGLKVIFSFPETVNYSLGRVYPTKVAYWVNLVKDHPALYGYLTVKEPSWNHISGSEIRSLYTAFHRADPTHPVIALFGDIPHFNGTANPWSAGMADILAVDWYPVETYSGGCSRSGRVYITTGPKWFNRIKSVLAAETPGTPTWLMVQTHKNLAPACHKKQLPTATLLRRQIREGFRYLGATGIAFHTWSNTNYTMDERRNPTMVSQMKTISNEVHAGIFQ